MLIIFVVNEIESIVPWGGLTAGNWHFNKGRFSLVSGG